MVRMKNLDTKIVAEYPHPKCRFGSKSMEVDAVYVKCTPSPRKINDPEPTFEERTQICVQCADTKPHEKSIIPVTVSLLGDFTDTYNSLPFRFYEEPEVIKIFPECGPQNGGTRVVVNNYHFYHLFYLFFLL